jgi:hypothetical protein
MRYEVSAEAREESFNEEIMYQVLALFQGPSNITS